MRPQSDLSRESSRLEALRRYKLLESSSDADLDELTRLAAYVCKAPVALISFVDEAHEWLKAKVGWSSTPLAREISFCGHAILQSGTFIIRDTWADERFAKNPLVLGEPHIRFYAGAPLLTPDGYSLGTLCVIDHVPRELDANQISALRTISRQVMAHLELQRQQEERENLETQALKAFPGNPLAMAIQRWPAGDFVDVNPAFGRLVGLPREQILGKTPVALGLMDESAAYALASRLAANLSARDVEISVRTGHGESRELLVGAELIELQGKPHSITTFFDMTGRLRAEKALRASEKRLRKLNRVHGVLSQISKHILREQDLPTMLARACDLAVQKGEFEMAWIGLSSPDHPQLQIRAHAGASEDTVALINRLMEGAPMENCAMTLQALQRGEHGVCNDIANDARAGNWREEALKRDYRSMASLPLVKRGAVVGTFNLYSAQVGFFDAEELRLLDDLAVDISFALEVHERERERGLLEERLQQAQKLEAIGQLAGGIAHDFNNILTIIQGFGSLLMLEELSPEATEATREIVNAADRAANLTRQLLAFGRRQVMQAQALDLNAVIRGLTSLLERIVGEDVRLKLNLYAEPLITRADAGMLDQVLMNLIGNARDAMPEGGELRIDTFERTLDGATAGDFPGIAAGRYVGLRVSDTGTGISPDDLPHIFEPFFTTKGPGKGTGLGLATVYGIVRQHRGSLHAESSPGRGTSIELLLPASQAVIALPTDATPMSTLPQGNETILVVEDDAHVRSLTSRILERQGYRVLEACHGPDALGVWGAQGGNIDLVLTDLVMPEGMDGRELAARLIRLKPGLRVVFMSGYSADTAGRELTDEEHLQFIQKPATPWKILQTVRRSLDAPAPFRGV